MTSDFLEYQPQIRSFFGIPVPPQVPVATTAQALMRIYAGDLWHILYRVQESHLHCVVPYFIEQEIWPAECFSQDREFLLEWYRGISAADSIPVLDVICDIPPPILPSYTSIFAYSELGDRFALALQLVDTRRPNLSDSLRYDLEQTHDARWWYNWHRAEGSQSWAECIQVLYPDTSLPELQRWLQEKEARETGRPLPVTR